jgi:hypothetical protein
MRKLWAWLCLTAAGCKTLIIQQTNIHDQTQQIPTRGFYEQGSGSFKQQHWHIT